MWISSAEQKILATWIEHCPALKLVSGSGGEIYYANQAFREWSEYTLAELKKLGWKSLSVDGDSLDADLDALRQLNDGYLQSYTVNKQYRTKSGAAKWGMLTVMRYPAAGNIDCFLCTFEPLKNGTHAAFSLAMERISEMTTAIDGVRSEVKTLTTMDEDATWVTATIKGIKRHPKIAGGLLAMMLSIGGTNQVVELLQRVGLVDLPVKVQPVNTTGTTDDATALNISDKQRYQWTITTPDGNVIQSPERNTTGDLEWLAKTKRQIWQTQN